MRLWVWIGRRARRILANKEEVANLSNWARKSMLGEFLLIGLFAIVCNRELSSVWYCMFLFFIWVQSGFWNFPETAWRSRMPCQATQAADPVSGFPPWTAWRQRMIRQATRARLWNFWLFWVFCGICDVAVTILCLNANFDEYSWLCNYGYVGCMNSIWN